MKKALPLIPYFFGMVLALTSMAFSLTGKLHTTAAGEAVTFSLSFAIGVLLAAGAGMTIGEIISGK